MKRTKKNIVASAIIILTICALTLICTRHIWIHVYGRMVDGIKGEITVNIDGSACNIKDYDFKFQKEGSCKVVDKKAKVSIKAHEYGGYEFFIEGIPDGGMITVNSYQHNDWNVTRFELDINVDTEKGEVYAEGYYTFLSESGSTIKEPISETHSIDENDIKISLNGL